MIAVTACSATSGSSARISVTARAGNRRPWPAVRRVGGRATGYSFVPDEQESGATSHHLDRTLLAVSGDSRSMTASAMPRSAAEGPSLRGILRRVADAAVTPLALDDVLDHFHPLRRGTELRGRIVGIVP